MLVDMGGTAQIKVSLRRGPQGYSLIEVLVVIVIIGIIAAVTLPTLVRQKAAANEASAINSVRILITAQTTYYGGVGGSQFGSMASLTSAGLIDGVVGSGTKAHYIFTVTPSGSLNFTIVAIPEAPGTTGIRGFFGDATGVIRYTTDGSAPNASSPPLSGTY